MSTDQPTDIVTRLRAETTAGGLDRWCDPRVANEAAAEIMRLRAEVAALRLTLGGRTFGASIPEPVGCPAPGACAQVAEIGRLRAIIRINGLRAGASHEEIDRVIRGE